MWRPMWPADAALESVIEKLTKRSPSRLLQDPHKMRQQKAVDPDTGELVGYCRWELPLSKQTKSLVWGSSGGQDQGDDGDEYNEAVEWSEAIVPRVSEDDMKRYKEMQKSAQWDYSLGAKKDELDDINERIKERILEGREFIGAFIYPTPLFPPWI